MLVLLKRSLSVALVYGIFFASCCAQSAPTNYTSWIWIGEHEFATEIANTPAAMQRGMMMRPGIEDNEAMLFVFTRPKPVTFWMKNTLIPLDMLFFNARGLLQEIKAAVPPCRTSRCPTYPSQYDDNVFVVEMQSGMAKKRNIQIGDKLNGCGFYVKDR
ncbi:MAG: hypothetical protein CSA47_00890 [Gammaproteobacteria bacterium]|nr:MAG: hypothetical protein CSA47_00890 [Gammaproteobacteria bacterium]